MDVEQENIRSEILKIISNEQAMHILEYSINAPKSAYEISTVCNIPLTQVYRWIRKLHNLGFVKISGATNNAGKKYFMYKSKVKTVTVTLDAFPGLRIDIS
jgi:predicted transcriptional regulator